MSDDMTDAMGAARLVPVPPDVLSDEQRALYDLIVSGRRGTGPQHFRLRHDDGSLTGPFDLMLRHPLVGRRLIDLGEALRFEGELTNRAREIAILVVAATRESQFEWYAHAPIARAAGMTEAELDAIRAGAAAPFTDPREIAVYAGARTLLAHGPIDAEVFDVLSGSLSTAELVELVALVGYYDLFASMMEMFAVGLPE